MDACGTPPGRESQRGPGNGIEPGGARVGPHPRNRSGRPGVLIAQGAVIRARRGSAIVGAGSAILRTPRWAGRPRRPGAPMIAKYAQATVVGRSGYTQDITIRQHRVAADEPKSSGGADAGPTPPSSSSPGSAPAPPMPNTRRPDLRNASAES